MSSVVHKQPFGRGWWRTSPQIKPDWEYPSPNSLREFILKKSVVGVLDYEKIFIPSCKERVLSPFAKFICFNLSNGFLLVKLYYNFKTHFRSMDQA